MVRGSRIYSVSISDKELQNWMDEMGDKLPSLSQLLRDGLLEKKREWEENTGETPKILRNKIIAWKKIADERLEFIQKKSLLEEFYDYQESMEKKIKFSEIQI